MLTPEQLAEIRKRADAATPVRARIYEPPFTEQIDITWVNPWDGRDEKIASMWWPSHPIEATEEAERRFESIATLWEHARQDIPALLDHIERLEMELAEARKQRDYEAEARARVNLEMDALAEKEIGE